MVMKLTPSLEETAVQALICSVFLLAPQLCAFATSHFDILDGLKYHRSFLDGINLKDQNLKDKS